MQQILISSKVFKNGEKIPVLYTCDGANISPPLSWSGIPAETRSIVLIMEDVERSVYWILFNIPPDVGELPEGVIYSRELEISRQGITSFGRLGYSGPCPPPGKFHRYYFKLYALDIRIHMPAGVTRANIENAMNGHVLATGDLMGIYER